MADLTVFDPIFTTTDPTQTHGLNIYDTLFALDSELKPQPQMVGNWGVSDDKKTFTFELRDGLGWHNGTPVTAADCVASIRRWGQAGGQLLMERAKDISKKDDKTFTIVLKEPLGVLIDMLGRIPAPCPFIMREKDAERPFSEQVTTNIGSGPFKFNESLLKPAQATPTIVTKNTYRVASHQMGWLAGRWSRSIVSSGRISRISRPPWLLCTPLRLTSWSCRPRTFTP